MKQIKLIVTNLIEKQIVAFVIQSFSNYLVIVFRSYSTVGVSS